MILKQSWPLQPLRWLSVAPFTRHKSSAQPAKSRIARGSRAKPSSKKTSALTAGARITPGSRHHNSLVTFRAYARRVPLCPSSTVYRGTEYEYCVLDSLQRLGFVLTRTGRKSDAGIDLQGHWKLEQMDKPVPVIVQCKAWTRCMTPLHVRELRGALQGAAVGPGVLGLLASQKEATNGVLAAIRASSKPLGYVTVLANGRVEQLVWNTKAEQWGLTGFGVAMRHSAEPEAHELHVERRGRRGMKKVSVEKTQKDIQLLWQGKPIYPGSEALGGLERLRALEPAVQPKQRKRGRPKAMTEASAMALGAQKFYQSHSDVKGTNVDVLPPGHPSGSGRGRPKKDSTAK